MNQDIVIELNFFLTSILWGVILLIMYDVFRILRRIIRHNSFFIFLEDIIYWVVSSILIFRMMYRQNNGIIRGFAILAILVGMFMYHGSVSDLLVNTISGAINGVLHIIIKCITTVLMFILKPFKFVFKGLKKIFGFLLGKIKKPLANLLKLLKNLRKSSKMKGKDKKKKEMSENTIHKA